MGSRLRGNDGARQLLGAAELACRARVIAERRRKHGFLFTVWVFLPDHGHAILLPRHPLTISEGMESIKGGSTLRINARRNESGLWWQPRFFDRALRPVKEYCEKVESLHLNPRGSIPRNAWINTGNRTSCRGTTNSVLLTRSWAINS